jgi:hypothetical protein
MNYIYFTMASGTVLPPVNTCIPAVMTYRRADLDGHVVMSFTIRTVPA